MEQIIKFIGECGTFYLVSMDRDQPRVLQATILSFTNTPQEIQL